MVKLKSITDTTGGWGGVPGSAGSAPPSLVEGSDRFPIAFHSSSHAPNPPAQSQLNAEQQKAALPTVPSLLEVCGFAYFYGGFLVGPQFTLRSYQSLVAGQLTDSPGKPPNR